MSYGRPDASLPLAPGSIYRRFRVLPPGQRLVNLPAERLIFQPCPTATESADFPRGSGPTVSMNGDAYKLAPFHGLASVDPPDLSALDGPTTANKLALPPFLRRRSLDHQCLDARIITRVPVAQRRRGQRQEVASTQSGILCSGKSDSGQKRGCFWRESSAP